MSYPVLGKTTSLFKRNTEDPAAGKARGVYSQTSSTREHTKVDPDLHPSFQKVLDTIPFVASVKKDGSCGAIFSVDDKWALYRRQDITKKSRNFTHVLTTGEKSIIAGHPCWVTTMVRGTGKHEKWVPVYFFDLDEHGLPEIDAAHIIGFTGIDQLEDKYVMSAFEPNPDNPQNPFIYASRFDPTSPTPLDVPIIKTTMQELARGNLVTVELMCRKFADHYGYTDDKCFVSLHGEEVIPADQLPEMTYEGLHEWFKGANPWANQEGVVFLVPSTGERFKLHRGHFNMEHTWREKKEAGLKFHYT